MQQFKDLKGGYNVFLFDRATVKGTQAKVISVTAPHYDSHFGNPADMVVDVTLEYEGQNKTFTFKDSTEVGYVGSTSISTGLEGFLRDVSALKTQLDQELSQVDTKKEASDKCAAILAEFDPAQKAKQENNERFSKIEQDIKTFGDDMKEMKTLMKSIVKELKG